LFWDERGRVLLVEPSYKVNWEIPGGVVEGGEPPWVAARRELMEEIGWDRTVGRLLVMDHGNSPDRMLFVFEGGMVTEEEVAKVNFPDGEIVSAGLYTLEEAAQRVRPAMAGRLTAALEAVREETVVWTEHGEKVAGG
jgi:ADP-ribose pyrophosphatase YjhB (NUDIX family)